MALTNGATRATTKQLVTTIGFVLSLLFIIIDKAFLQIGSQTKHIEEQVAALTQTALDNKQRIARLEEAITPLRDIPKAVYAQTEAIATIKATLDKLDTKFDAHVGKDIKATANR